MKRRMLFMFGPLVMGAGAFGVTQPGELSTRELETLLKTMHTQKDHLRLAAHFEALAKRYESEAAEHAARAKLYKVGPKPSGAAMHCEYLSESLGKASKEARAMAEEHKDMAKK